MNPRFPPASQAIILAAGRGSRMLALTEQQPKCLVPLLNRPILDWTLDALRANGIKDILIIAGWQHESLAGRCNDVRINSNWQVSNMVRSLILAEDWLLCAPSLIVYGDGAYGPSCIRQVLARQRSDWVVPIDRLWAALWQRRFANPLDDAESLERDGERLLSIGQSRPTLSQVQGQFMGLLHLQPAAWQRASKHLQTWQGVHGPGLIDQLDMTTLLQRLLLAGESMQCVEVDGGWVEIDSESDLRCVTQGIADEGFSHDFRT
jgi:choline kinase